MQKTLRVDVIHKAFQRGSLLVTLGIFMQLWMRSEILATKIRWNFLVSKTFGKPALDMIKHVNMFPCSLFVTAWLHGIFIKLESDWHMLAYSL